MFKLYWTEHLGGNLAGLSSVNQKCGHADSGDSHVKFNHLFFLTIQLSGFLLQKLFRGDLWWLYVPLSLGEPACLSTLHQKPLQRDCQCLHPGNTGTAALVWAFPKQFPRLVNCSCNTNTENIWRIPVIEANLCCVSENHLCVAAAVAVLRRRVTTSTKSQCLCVSGFLAQVWCFDRNDCRCAAHQPQLLFLEEDTQVSL